MKIILLIGMIISVLSFSSCPERCDYFTIQKNGKELECSSCCYFFFPFLCQVGCLEQKTAEEHFYSGVEKANSGDYQGAIEDYDKAIELNPKDAEAYYNRGLAKIGMGQKDSGCLDLSKARELGHSGAYQRIKEYCK